VKRGFATEFIGKRSIDGHVDRCPGCGKLTLLGSYTTTRCAKWLGLPLLPLGRVRVLDECPHCGRRGCTSHRRLAKVRKQDLKAMMEGFTRKPDDPGTCAHGLHTLMVYDEKAWFLDVMKTYGLRFEKEARIQALIAQGLCRFGQYDEAAAYCRKALVLGGGKPIEELLEKCEALRDHQDDGTMFDALRPQPEGAWAAYVPAIAAAAATALFLLSMGISSTRNYRAWLVNGSLRKYHFQIDDTDYSLAPGGRMPVKLRLGSHVLHYDSMPDRTIEYDISLLKQLLGQHLLVINPDAMALLEVETAGSGNPQHAIGGQVHLFPGVRLPWFGLRQRDNALEHEKDMLSLHRPPTHAEMVAQLHALGMDAQAAAYARQALRMEPATPEAEALLRIALDGADPEAAEAFLRHGTSILPPLLPWHLRYQDYAMLSSPGRDLVGEYTARCKEHPDEPAFFYLLGRIAPDRADARKLFVHAERGGGMGGLGYFAIAHDHFNHAEFAEARPYSQQAMERAPRRADFLRFHESILLALRDYDALLALLERHETDDPELPGEEVYYLTCAGYHREAEAAALRHHESRGTPLPKLTAVRYHAVGNIESYLDCLAESADPHAAIERHLHRGEVAQADALVSATEEHAYWEHLVLYCAAMASSQAEIAERHWSRALDEIDAVDPAAARERLLLSAPTAPTEDAVERLDLPAREKALVLAALAFRFPEQREAFNSLSGKFNFEPGYPRLLLKAWTAPRRLPSGTASPEALQPAA